jgi:hypothetical protein
MWAVFASFRFVLALCRSSVGEGSVSVAVWPQATASEARTMAVARQNIYRSIGGPDLREP